MNGQDNAPAREPAPPHDQVNVGVERIARVYAEALLDAADSVIADLRLANGCEDWATADWNSPEVGAVSELAETAIELRQQARALREAHLAAVREALDARQAA